MKGKAREKKLQDSKKEYIEIEDLEIDSLKTKSITLPLKESSLTPGSSTPVW